LMVSANEPVACLLVKCFFRCSCLYNVRQLFYIFFCDPPFNSFYINLLVFFLSLPYSSNITQNSINYNTLTIYIFFSFQYDSTNLHDD
jgi:hypothetical protein